MIQRIIAGLTRQKRALELLGVLQEEEFSLLTGLKPQSVSALEFSIQELLRQILAERLSMRALIKAAAPGTGRVTELLDAMEATDREKTADLLAAIDRLEQSRAIQAEKNRQMALALFDQSTSYIQLIQKAASPKAQTYGRRGAMAALRGTSQTGHSLGRT